MSNTLKNQPSTINQAI